MADEKKAEPAENPEPPKSEEPVKPASAPAVEEKAPQEAPPKPEEPPAAPPKAEEPPAAPPKAEEPPAAAPKAEEPPKPEEPPKSDSSKDDKDKSKSDKLETTGKQAGQPVLLRSKKTKKRPRTRRKSDIPDCKTVDKCSAKSNDELSQNEWLNDLIKDDRPPSICGGIKKFLCQYKYQIIGGIAIVGLVAFFAMKKGCGTKRCPFTGKK
ncbi:unnamed protein product [Caenorhabditis bovis]|uniref:Uncharacterized protein n=1 Tax=Caenorhabditis bovis TaxID=2654633 RepID=A0A8S1ETC5_9PELO|nr:unnamed protein product [Caenorhabditis bovis]